MAEITNSIMIFKIGEQLFGYRTKYISETINIDKIFSVPLSSDAIKGLINFRNNVVGIIDIGIMLWNKSINSDLVVIVKKDDIEVGLVVDNVKGIVNIQQNDFKDIKDISLDDIHNDINHEYLDSYFEYNNNLVLMLNIDSMINYKSSIGSKSNLSKTIQKSNKQYSKGILNQNGYILFQISQEWYGIELKSINEIVTYPEHITPLPMSENYIKGAFKLRENSVIIADLSEILNINSSVVLKHVIVVNHNNQLVGISIDNVRELKWVKKDDILPINRKDTIQKGILTLDNGNRLALLLDVKSIINSISKNIETKDKLNLDNNKDSIVKNNNIKTYIQFRVGDVDMALPVKSVDEVVELSDIKALPKASDYILGMMNLRNSTLVIISLKKRLGIASNKSEEEQYLVVLDGESIGLVVDELKGILDVDDMYISKPNQSIELEENFMDGIIQKESDDMVFILNNEIVTKHTNVEKLINKNIIDEDKSDNDL